MGIFQLISAGFSGVSNGQFGADENRRIRFVNYIGLIGFANLFIYGVVYGIIDAKLYLPAIVFYLSMAVVTLGIIVVNSLGFYNQAKVLIVTLFPFYILVNSTWFFGKAPGSHMFFLLFSLIPLFLWDLKKAGYIFTFTGLNIALYFAVEFLPSVVTAKYEIPLVFLDVFRSTNILVSFLCIGIAIFVYQKQASKNENQLSKQAFELEKSKQHQDMVYSVIAHDLRSPFNGLLGLSELMLNGRENFDKNKTKSITQAIFRSATTLNTLLENLLDWSKMQSGNMTKEISTFEIVPLVNEVLHLLEDVIKEKNLKVSNMVDGDTFVTADAYMVATVFRNLITNAVKFTPNNGFVTIESKKNKNKMEFCISDSGVGIPDESLKGLFDLQSVYVTHGTNLEKGSGLGLKLCRGFVEENGGSLWASSIENKGSKFYFTLKS